jgi:hypothetical protein
MDFDSGLPFQIGREFFERRVRLPLDLPAQQSQALVIEGGRIAATVRLRGQAVSFTKAAEQTRDGAPVNLEGCGHLIKRPSATLVSHDDLLA